MYKHVFFIKNNAKSTTLLKKSNNLNFVLKKIFFCYIHIMADKRNIIFPMDVNKLTIKELRNIAKKRNMIGYRKKNKKDLVDFIDKELDSKIQYEIRETNSAIKGFTNQYTIDGSDGIDAMSFLNDVQPQVTDLMSKHRQKKINFILTCTMEKIDIKTGDTLSVNAPFLSKTGIVLDATDVRELYQNVSDKVMESMAKFEMQGSNWRFKRVVKLDINTAVYKPLKGNSYIPLPKKLAERKAIINMQNEDEHCFKWCITRALNPVNRDSERITKNLREQSENWNWTNIKFPVSLRDIDKFEKNNSGIRVNVFGYDKGKIYPLRHSKDENAIDLLLISDGKKQHYCWIKNFDRLMARRTNKSCHSMHYCKRCLNGFTSIDALTNHKMYCDQQDAVRREYPEPNTILCFNHYNRSMRVPFVIYADFESCIKPIATCQPNPNDSYTNKYQKHIPISFCIYVKCIGNSVYTRPPITYINVKNLIDLLLSIRVMTDDLH